MRPLTSALTLVLSLSAAAAGAPPTYLGVGDIAAAGGTELRIMASDGATSTGYPLTGVTPGTSLWDPQHPDDLILGQGTNTYNQGSLIRVSFTGPGQATPSVIAPYGSFARPMQISWDQAGTGVIVVTQYDQVHRVDVSTGAVTALTNGAQPWGTNVTAGVMDRLTGDIYVGTSSGGVWRLAPGASGPTAFATGLGSIKKLLVDTNAAPHSLYVVSSGALRRIALGGPVVAEPYFGTTFTPPAPGSVAAADFDQHGDFVVATTNEKLWRVPNPATLPATGVAPTYIGQYAFPNTSGDVHDITVIGTTSEPFRLTLEPVPVLAAKIGVENVPGPIGVGYIYLSASTWLPAGSGPFFGLMPDALTLAILNISPTPGGLLVFTGTAPSTFTTPPLTMAPFFGQTWDGVSAVFAPNGQLLGRSNVVRVTWQ